MKYPLRFIIPVVLLVIAIAISIFSAVAGFRHMDEDVEQSGLAYVTQEMSELQSRLRHDLQDEDAEAIRRDIAEKGSAREVELVLFADDNNVIRYSSSLKLLGQPVVQAVSGIDHTLLMQARLKMIGQTQMSNDRSSIYAYFPVVMGVGAHELRPSRVGVLFMKYDLLSMKATHRHAIYQQMWWSLPFYAVSFLLLGIFLHYVFNRRVMQVIVAANQFAAGDASSRTRLQGKDEIAQIGKAFDSMADKVSSEEIERKKAQEERQKSLRLFKSVVENAPVRVFWKDTESRFLGCNYLFARDAGYLKPEEVIGKTDFDMGWKDQAELYRADDRMVMKTQVPKLRFEEPQTTPDGRLIWLRTSKVPMHDENGQIIGIMGIYEDITEQKLAEEALRGSYEAYHNILTATLDGFWLVDPKGGLIDVNKRYAGQSGYTREELLEMRITDLEAAENPEQIATHIQRVIETGSDQFETMHRRKDGSVWHVEISTMYQAADGGKFYVFIRDITGRKQAEEDLLRLNVELEQRVMRRTAELNKLNAKLLDTQFAMDRVGIGIEWVECETGRFIDVNRYNAEMLGYSIEEMRQMGVTDIDPNFPPDAYSWIRDMVRQNGHMQIESIHKAKDGHDIPVSVSIDYHEGTEDSPARFISFVTDITKRKEAEQTILAAKEAAESANRSKSEFLANMSHEIRTPLNAVLGMAHLLKDTPLDYRQRVYLKNIEGASSILLGVINDILDFSKIEAGKLKLESAPFDLLEVMNNLSVVAAAATKNKDIDVVFQIARSVPRNLEGDALRLGQVLVNLTNNAIKFTQQGEVVIRVAVEAASESEVALVFSVTDTGIGMNPEQLDNLFKAFSQADTSITRRFGGTGLGLAIASRLAKAMGSRIAVESELGKGSTFSFNIKLKRGGQQNLLWVRAPETLRDLSILIVESNPLSRSALHEMVQSFGWSSEVFDSDASVREYLTGGAPKLFDIAMIGTRVLNEENLVFVRKLVKLLPEKNRPQILLIANAGNEALWKNIEGGVADAILTKPFTPSNLLDMVAELLLTSRTRRANLQAATPSVGGFAGVRILVAEDNEMNQFLISELLQKRGIEVTLAGNGVECLHQLEADPGRFDLVLMDMQMPEMDGVEAAKRIRSDLKLGELPIVALTANVLPQDRQRCLDAGMCDFLPKPIDPNNLDQVLHRCIPGGEAKDIPVESALPNENEETGFPSLPGVNSARVLQRLEGNKELYTSLLLKFLENQKGIGAQLRKLFVENSSRDEAIRLAHTLKGLAATIGAEELARHAMELEHCLKEGDSVSSCMARLDQIETLMTPLLKAIEEIRAAHATAAPAATSQQVDKTTLEKLVKKALGLLQEFNAAAEEPLEQICAALGGGHSVAQAAKVFKLAAGYDYEAAAKELRQLAREMDIQV